MRSEERTGDRITITHDDTRWTRLCLLIGIAFILLALFIYWKHPADTKRAMGCLGAATVFGIFFLAGHERSVFIFDRGHRVVQWSRRRALSQKQGTIPFEEIEAVVARTPIGDTGTPSRRIALLTKGGELPLSVAYVPDMGSEILRTAADLNQVIGRPAENPLTDSLQGLVKAGHSLDALRLLRQERTMSLGEAYGEIEKLKAGIGQTSSIAPPFTDHASAIRRPPLRIVERSTINRPVSSVWPYVILSDYFRQWNSKIIAMDAPDEFRLGQSFATRYRMGKKEIQCLSTVAEIKDDRLLVLHHTNCMGENIGPGLDVVERITLQEKKGRTRVRKVVTIRNHGIPWLFIPIIWFVANFGSAVEPDTLKMLCEADG